MSDMHPEYFARNQYHDHVIYRKLAETEPVEAFRKTLEELSEHEKRDFLFWRDLSEAKTFTVHPLKPLLFRLMRRVLGLTFTVRFLERRERKLIQMFEAYYPQAHPELRENVEIVIEHAREHELKLIEQIREDRVKFISSIVLGLNDGLIELSGALVGFSFAFRDPGRAGIAGIIMGVAASLSIAASAYLQAKHEKGKDPKKAAAYSGAAFLTVVVLLTVPFFLISHTFAALGLMAAVMLLLIAVVSFYTAVIFTRPFQKQFGQMLMFSVGVGIIAYGLGTLLGPSA